MDFVASGTLPNGKAVVLKGDGQVEVISGTTFSESIPAGSEAIFNTGNTVLMSVSAISFDPNTAGKFVVAYRDSSNSRYGTACVGTISGTSISFGAEVVFNSGNTYYSAISFDPNAAGKFVVAYMDNSNSNYGTAIIGTMLGTSISFGSEVVFNSGESTNFSVSFDPNTANKFVITYMDSGNSSYGTAIVGTRSGTSISFGSEVVFNSSSTDRIDSSFDPNNANKFVAVYWDAGNSYYGTAIVGTVSGTSISFGSEYVYNSAATYSSSISFDPSAAGKFVVTYKDNGNSNYGTAIIGIVSGTSISYGSESVFNLSATSSTSVAFDPNNSGKFVVAYQDGGNSQYGTVIVGTVSGTSISYGSEFVVNATDTYFSSVAFDPNNSGKFVVAYQDSGATPTAGAAIVGQIAATATNLTSTNFVGITSKAISNTATGPITLQGGISTNQSSLTVGSTYYVQANGTVSTVSTSPAVNIGKAISATSLILKG